MKRKIIFIVTVMGIIIGSMRYAENKMLAAQLEACKKSGGECYKLGGVWHQRIVHVQNDATPQGPY